MLVERMKAPPGQPAHGELGHGLAALTWMAARRSDRVIAISESAKTDIVRFLHIPAERIDVTYPGTALRADASVGEATLRHDLDLGGGPIVLTVPAKRPHKNLERLFEAFMRVRAGPPPVLVVTGYETFHEEALHERGDQLGAVGGSASPAGSTTTSSTASTRPRRASFSRPWLRASACRFSTLSCAGRRWPARTRRPCRRSPATPSSTFEPTNTDAIAAAIERLLQDSALRDRLRAAGREQAMKFSWRRTAEGTLSSYERVLANARS
jgi:glycosyltransferase involved in cell wall biosynthesis